MTPYTEKMFSCGADFNVPRDYFKTNSRLQKRYSEDGTEKCRGCRGLLGSPGGGVLNKVLYGEAPPRGPTPYPFIYHFGRKGTPFIYLL